MALLMRKEWRLNAAVPQAGTLAERILHSRGLFEPAQVSAFLNPSLDFLHDPFLLPDMDQACAVIIEAINSHETLFIHGDYDVDGITATALLSRFLRRIGVPCREVIPDRMTDGYGLTSAGAARILAEGGRFLVTVDCGIASLEEISQLRQAGVRVIVTDHHECQPTLPPAEAVVNPKRSDSSYPFRGLAGVGVALKLIQAISIRMNLGDLWQADLELAALGTVADVVPLLGENRMIVSTGLARISKKQQCGLAALIEAVGLSEKTVTAQTLGYVLAPRINAAGRLGNASVALDLLLTEDPAVAAVAAASLSDLNRRRQEMEISIMAEAIQDIDNNFDFTGSDLIVVARENWHHGVIGIVAARLAEQYCRPVIVMTGEDGVYRGSCRTWGDYDILAAISAASQYTVKFGGHRKAAGLVVKEDELADFIQAINEHARKTLQPEQLRPTLQADLEVSPAELTVANALALQQLAPFGEDNPQPQLICRKLPLSSVRLTGNGRHLKLQLSAPDRQNQLDAIAFGLGEADDLFAQGDAVDILFSLDLNEWMGRATVQLTVRDIRHSDCQDELLDRPWLAEEAYGHCTDLKPLMNQFRVPLQALKPSHNEYKAVYQFIKARYGEQPLIADLSLLSRRVARSYGFNLNGFRLARILTVFEETGLLSLQRLGADRVRLALLPAANRVRLEDSPTYQRLQAEEESP
ncbi:MAG TPA: single-stranded-DNA-specific exonuclease RecJ [Clostridiales bacterium]|nr:single-stranded-DNA-specific exonuclease RecJ [Clostridiales bacterium]